jgi:hypothetical protein
MTPVSPETMAREYAALKWSGPENGHLKVYAQNDFRAGYQAGYSAALAAPLTEEERGEIAYALCKEDADRIEAAHCRQYCELAERSFKKRCPYLGAVDAAFARLVQLRTANGEKK